MSEQIRTAGVLGGMGPDATVDFMAGVLALTPARRDQDHIRLLVDQNPRVPDRQSAIANDSADGGNPADTLASMAKGLEQQGADFLVMPCNAAHAYESAIREAVAIPFVSIVDVALDAIAGYSRIGLVATRGALDAGLYQAALGRREMNYVLPTADEAAEINRLVFGVKGGDRSATVAAGLREICHAVIDRGADVIVGACTEIPLVVRNGDLPVPFISTTEELARRTVALALGQENLPAV